MRRRRLAATAVILLVTAACSHREQARSGAEDAQLNDAAAALEANGADVNSAEIVDEPEGNVE